MFAFIDYINQVHYETKQFIYLKAIPMAKETDSPVIVKLYWENQYCPIEDKSLQTKVLGQGDYGKVYLITDSMMKCCPQLLQFVIKQFAGKYKGKIIDVKQLEDLQLDVTSIEKIAPTKKSDIFATE